ncbi:lipoprotein [Anaerocolumna cellulosilytica]|uniref:Lipoprotein n=1 Tax=Anaerocolumna cellulosilytica TaxID=433286 RepID=A0A6S6R642_9FIRM|nr:MetQ/NlpA family ABC transporter substrate-binding protein [Anaerocolumna cellulosilytica]MBB5197894.1 D-methionine transport system substrate-binding protein [Anaerocolumna cellulosilytica]BCJ95557.1 lipoprotein [Anaerocolumna cellulosilytica]
MKKLSVLLMAFVLVSALLVGCGTKENDNTTTPEQGATPTEAGSETEKPVKEETNTEEPKELIKIVVGATIEPHATILNSEAVKNALAEQGYSIEVVEYTDYVQPNAATEDGSLDANFFQHVPYLNDFNKNNGTNLVSVANVHFEPLGIYPGKTASLDAIPDKGQVAVPNDTSNEARALLLLEKAGLIKLKEGVGLEATIKDILENPKNLDIVEIEAAQTAKVLQDVELAVINGNYALTEGLSANEDALLVEDAQSEGSTTYANVLVVKAGNEETDKTKALIKAVTSEETKRFIEEQWKGAVVPVF